MLADVRHEQPSESVNEHAGSDNGDKRDDPLREKRVIRKVRLGNGLEIELLPLRLDARRLQRCECRGQGLLGELVLRGEAFVLGQRRDLTEAAQ